MRRCWNINAFTINCKLPSLNEVIAKNRSNKYLGAKFKKDIEEVIGWSIRQALASKTLKPTNDPSIIVIEWHKKDKRMDIDNIHSAVKFILDTMQKHKIIPNDNRKYIKQIYQQVIDDKEEYCLVQICKCDSVILTIL